MSLIQWPFNRKQDASKDNPRYVSDIVAANQSLSDALQAIGGFSNPGFAIISGLAYDGTGNYSSGIFYLNGQFYYIGSSFSSGLYLTGGVVDILSSPFPDGTINTIYSTYVGSTSTSSTGASPMFSGSMNQYRINLTQLKTDLSTAISILSTLGGAATLNVGNTTGTVMPGDYAYSKTETNALIPPVANQHRQITQPGTLTGTGSLAAMSGLTSTYTPAGNHALIMFSSVIHTTVPTQAYVINILVNGVIVQTTGETIQGYYDAISFQIMVPVTLGSSTTISMSWNTSANITSADNSLTIIDLP